MAAASSAERGRSATWSSAEEVALAAPWSSKSSDDGGARVVGQRVGPAQLVEGGVERGAGVLLGGVAEAPLEQLAVGARPSAVAPEVEQAAGDDVALDLGAAAVDRGRPRVEELGAPPVARRVVAER